MNVAWLNWSWLVAILPTAGIGFLLGAFLRRLWEDDEQKVSLAGKVCITAAIAAWSAAYFSIAPLATNATAFGALAIRQGLYGLRNRSSALRSGHW
jgi:hypothetical protein